MSNAKLKNGKEPLSSKYQVLHETEYTKKDKLALSQKQEDYLANNGLDGRFLYRKHYEKNNNFHRSGWTVIPDSDMPGSNAEGLVIVEDLVLGVRTKQASAAHKAAVNERTARQSGANVIKAEKAKLQQALVSAGVKGKIIEGFEENADDEE
jgi:hypothetical protein